MEAIFWIILIIAIYVSYRVSSNKGYSGILFGIGAFLFPILAIIVFALPDKSQAAKRAEINRAFDESMEEQKRKIDEMSARIRELEKQQQESAQPKAEAQKQAEPKAETKPAEPETEEEFDEPEAEDEGKPLPLNVEDDGAMADLVVELEHARSCYKKKMYFLALPYFEKGAKAGHLESQMYCGQMYYHGQGRDVDFEKALYWYERAAEQGEVTAQGNCGIMYKAGRGCSVNLEKALYWKEKAAEQGNAQMQLETGMMYELGEGCDVDLEKARHWYEKAAEQGNADAKRLLDGMSER